jgi:hypothetical protein
MLLPSAMELQDFAGQMRIRLIRKLAEAIDGVDIADYVVGDVVDLEPDEARLLVAEGWAVLVDDPQRREIRQSTTPTQVAEAADSTRRNPIDRLRRAFKQIDRQRFEPPHDRRREDAPVDDPHDSRAGTIHTTDD